MEQKIIISKIAEFHRFYESDFLTDRIRDKNNYLESTQKALFFILSYSFYQGRRDELSGKFEEKAKVVLKKFLSNEDILSLDFERLTLTVDLRKRYVKLYDLLKYGEVNKENDRLMVISIINFIQSNNEKNILKFLTEEIKSKNVADVHRKLDQIWSIGQKIASLILRDIVYIYKLESYLNKEDYYYLQPIDTWVHKLSMKLKITEENEININEAQDIVDKCFELEINPIQFNQGAWYIGANSLQILLKNITKVI